MSHEQDLRNQGARVGSDAGKTVDETENTTPREAGDRVQDETKGIENKLKHPIKTFEHTIDDVLCHCCGLTIVIGKLEDKLKGGHHTQ